jgi:hypothetical protein
MDRFATQSECGSKQRSAARGLTPRPTSDCGRCGFSMALIWTKLAAHKERLQRLNAQGA